MFALKGNTLYLDQLHLQGFSGGNFGMKGLFNTARDLGRHFDVNEVVIQGGKRTIGKYKGQVPLPIKIKVN